MQRLVSFARAAWCATFALALASACGGHSRSGGDDGSDAGGATGRADSSSSGGGIAQAGSSSSDDACSGPSELGTCSAAFQRWTHDSTIGLCVPVGYGGCGATKNNYETLEACQKACAGRGASFDACKAPTDCVLVSPGCCGVCDGPFVSKHDFITYNKTYEGRVQTCPDGNVACGACPDAGGSGTRKYFIPNCVNGECVVEDIRETAVTACMTAEDCRLRNGTACCESCGSSDDVVAVRRDDSLSKLVCVDGMLPCSTCNPTRPVDAVPSCNETGHCSIVYLLK